MSFSEWVLTSLFIRDALLSFMVSVFFSPNPSAKEREDALLSVAALLTWFLNQINKLHRGAFELKTHAVNHGVQIMESDVRHNAHN